MQSISPSGELAEKGGGPEEARFQERFLPWWHTSLECLVAAQKLFRRFDDDDLTCIYLTAWRFALEQIESRQPPPPGSRIVEFLANFDSKEIAGENLAHFAEVTGVPRETVRRKLEMAISLALVERVEAAGFRLRTLSTDILPMFENCLGLSRVLLGCLGRGEIGDGADLSATAWISMMRAYLDLLLSFWAVRRRSTRVSSAISVQSVVELLTVLKSYRRLAADGTLLRTDLATFLSVTPKVRQTPYFVSQIASMSGLNVARVRRMCRNLEAQGRLEFIGHDEVRPLPQLTQVSADFQEAYFSEEMLLAGRRFVSVALGCFATAELVGSKHA
mgnify:CR=1 FL=1